MNKWISVKDRFPDKNGRYLCYYKTIFGSGMEVYDFATNLEQIDKYDFYRKNRCGWYVFESDYGFCECVAITHWMPLPEAPESEI